MGYPRAGAPYPRSVGEFQSWFPTDADCLDYLEWLRWPDGFVCPSRGAEGGWRLGDGRFMCAACGARSTVTAGTIFDRTVWFTACWLFATGKDGISARIGSVPHLAVGHEPVRVTIHDALGQTVRTLVSQEQGSGAYRVEWDGRDEQGRSLATGAYSPRLLAGDAAQYQRMMLIK